MTTEELRQNRDRGIAFLNSEAPEWRGLISVQRLDMAFYDHCILGQLVGTYDCGLEEFSLTDEEATKYGFCTRERWADCTDEAKFFEEYARLTEVWKESEVWEVA